MKATWRAAASACAVATLLSACGGPPPSAKRAAGPGEGAYLPENDPLINPPELYEVYPGEGAAAEDETLVRFLIGEPRSINPFFASSWQDFYFMELLFDQVYYRNQELDYVPSRVRVESVEESEDHLVTTVHLKKGLFWHDGHPWTAHDVQFSWEAIVDDHIPAAHWKHMAGEIEEVKALDDHTVRYRHKQPSPTQRMNMAFPILPKHIYDVPEERAKDPTLTLSKYYNRVNREVMIGSGAYRFVEWKTNDRLIVERWEDYPFEKPHFKRVILKVQPDRNIALLLFKNEELDELMMTPQQFATQTNDDDFAAVGVKAYGNRRVFAYIGWNMDGSNPFFADKRVRLALAHAYDRERVLRDVTYNLYTPSNGIFDPEHFAHNASIKPIDMDLEKAGQLLDEAGWRLNPDDGWRYKTIDGEPIKFDFEMLWAQSFADATKVAAIYAEDLKKIGVAFRTRVIENATFDAKNYTHEFQAHISVFEVSSDADQWWNYYHSEQYDKGRNFMGYKNEKVDELFALARREFDREKRAEYYGEIQRLIFEDQPNLFLWNYSLLHGFHKRMRGIQRSPAGVLLFFPSHRGWWVPAGEQLR